MNGAVPFYSISKAPGPNDYIGKAIVDIEHPSNSISSSAQAFMPFDIHHWADDTMMNWTFTIERELMKNTALRLSYIGAHGYNLEQRWRWNDPEAQWNYQARTGLATSGDQAVTVDGTNTSTVVYAVPARSSRKLQVSGSNFILVGSFVVT